MDKPNMFKYYGVKPIESFITDMLNSVQNTESYHAELLKFAEKHGSATKLFALLYNHGASFPVKFINGMIDELQIMIDSYDINLHRSIAKLGDTIMLYLSALDYNVITKLKQKDVTDYSDDLAQFFRVMLANDDKLYTVIISYTCFNGDCLFKVSNNSIVILMETVTMVFTQLVKSIKDLDNKMTMPLQKLDHTEVSRLSQIARRIVMNIKWYMYYVQYINYENSWLIIEPYMKYMPTTDEDKK
jgi:hypothetical protein